jgi:Flavodoxin
MSDQIGSAPTALVIFESMYGNTHVIADHVADGLRGAFATDVVSAATTTGERMAGVDLVVVGAPTHVHGLPGRRSREAAATAVQRSPDDLALEADALGPGLRELFEQVGRRSHAVAAAFDTRLDGPAIFTGRASRGIAKRLRDRGFHLVAAPESFLVDKHNRLLDGEADRATSWGRAVAASVTAADRRARQQQVP